MSENLRILVVDDDRRMAKTLSDIFSAKGYFVGIAHSGAEALEKVRAAGKAEASQFGCVLTDVRMPEMNGIELHKAITEIEPALSVVLMTAYATDDLVREGLERGAIASLTKPLKINSLLNFFAALRKKSVIAIVDDDPKFCSTLRQILWTREMQVTIITDPSRVVEALTPDVQTVLLDMKLNVHSGLGVLKKIRLNHPRLPVVLVTGYREEMAAAIETGLRINAYTCLYKPVEIKDLLKVLAEIRHQELGSILGRPFKKRR